MSKNFSGTHRPRVTGMPQCLGSCANPALSGMLPNAPKLAAEAKAAHASCLRLW